MAAQNPTWIRSLDDAELLSLIPERAVSRVETLLAHKVPRAECERRMFVAFKDVVRETSKVYPFIELDWGHRPMLSMARSTRRRVKSGALWYKLLEEFRLLLCTRDPKYKTLRQRLRRSAGQSGTLVVAMVSAVLATYLGIAAGAVVPLCAVCLLGLARVGKEAFCKELSREP